jgi:hypothetical protein
MARASSLAVFLSDSSNRIDRRVLRDLGRAGLQVTISLPRSHARWPRQLRGCAVLAMPSV